MIWDWLQVCLGFGDRKTVRASSYQSCMFAFDLVLYLFVVWFQCLALGFLCPYPIYVFSN